MLATAVVVQPHLSCPAPCACACVCVCARECACFFFEFSISFGILAQFQLSSGFCSPVPCVGTFLWNAAMKGKKPPCKRFDDFPHAAAPPTTNFQQPTATTTTPSDSQRQGTIWWLRFSLTLTLLYRSRSCSFSGSSFFFVFGRLMMMFVAVCVCICHARHINLGEWHAWRLTERDYRVFSLPMPTREPRPTGSHWVPQCATVCGKLFVVSHCRWALP